MSVEVFLSTLSLRRATWGRYYAAGGIGIFLSTLSLRRATLRGKAPNKARYNFYPRSPCGERLFAHPGRVGAALFLSTLSLRRATIMTTIICIVLKFLSTLSLRRATSWLDVEY